MPRRRLLPTDFSPGAGRGSSRSYFGASGPGNYHAGVGYAGPQAGLRLGGPATVLPGGRSFGPGNLPFRVAPQGGGNHRPGQVLPPPGWYDPALQAQLRASHRGLGDLTRDTELATARAGQDYTFNRDALGRTRDRGFEDVDRQLEVLGRSYGELGRRQAEQAAQMGVINPAIAARQMQIRAQNMAFDRQPLDTARSRLGQDYDTGLGLLDVGFGRERTDRETGLRRARREDSQFGLDVGEQMRFQATQAGWIPPGRRAGGRAGGGGGGGTGGARAPERRRRQRALRFGPAMQFGPAWVSSPSWRAG